MDQNSSTELEIKIIGPAVAELQHLKEFGCPTGMPRRARWANDHAAAHLRAKMDPWKLRWSSWEEQTEEDYFIVPITFLQKEHTWVSWSSHLPNGNSYTWKDSLHNDMGCYLPVSEDIATVHHPQWYQGVLYRGKQHLQARLQVTSGDRQKKIQLILYKEYNNFLDQW